MPDYGGILRVLNPKDLSAAAMDLERAKGRVLQELAYLFEHGRRLQCGQCTCKCVELLGPPGIIKIPPNWPGFLKNSA